MPIHLPHVVVGGRHLAYYVAIGTVLLIAWAWKLKRRRSQQALVADVPFYKAGKTTWMFDAETAILDSYSKVRSTSQEISLLERHQNTD